MRSDQSAKLSAARPPGGKINNHCTVVAIGERRRAGEVSQELPQFDVEQLTELQKCFGVGALGAGLKSPQLVDADRSSDSKFVLVDAENGSLLCKTLTYLEI